MPSWARRPSCSPPSGTAAGRATGRPRSRTSTRRSSRTRRSTPFTGQPFRMEHRDGRLFIYSLGPNLRDEHGAYDPKKWATGRHRRRRRHRLGRGMARPAGSRPGAGIVREPGRLKRISSFRDSSPARDLPGRASLPASRHAESARQKSRPPGERALRECSRLLAEHHRPRRCPGGTIEEGSRWISGPAGRPADHRSAGPARLAPPPRPLQVAPDRAIGPSIRPC